MTDNASRVADAGLLEKLVEKWRAEIRETAGTGCGCYGKARMLGQCANELEAALRSGRRTTEETHD